MSFYGTVSIPDNAVLKSYSTAQGIPLGQLGIAIHSGRLYRWAENAGTLAVAGGLNQSELPVANHDDVTADVARAIGARQISATLGATLAALDASSRSTWYSRGAAMTIRSRRSRRRR